MSVLLFGTLVVIALILTVIICFLIVDHIDNSMFRHRILDALWGTGYMGHTIFALILLGLMGLVRLFENYPQLHF